MLCWTRNNWSMKMKETSREWDKKLTDNNNQDSSIYLAEAAMSQPWTYRYPLIDFHGNNGSLDGDGEAADRYTEGRLAKASYEILEDVMNKHSVEFQPNYSETATEPKITLVIPNDKIFSIFSIVLIPPPNCTGIST